MTFPADFYEYLDTHTLIGIKGGTQRDTFLDIWMVRVGDRVFARSWEKSRRSWFTAFEAEGVGEIRYGEQVLSVRGYANREAAINAQIDAAYRAKYTSEQSRFYVEGITQPEYADFTMEFELRPSILE